jgi:hypothetical protein
MTDTRHPTPVTRHPTPDDAEVVAAILRSAAPADVPADFLARVNARIDETAGWLGLADFRVWTLRLVPAAAALALIAVLWPGTSATTSTPTSSSTSAVSQASTFSPTSAADWQQGVTGETLLEAALRPAGGTGGR